jgi:hypothetical protein
MSNKSPLLLLSLIASGACGALPLDDDNPQKPAEVQPVAQPLTDGFTNVRLGKVALKWDGSRMLAVWEALDARGIPQLAGQMFNSNGAALTTSRLLTSMTTGSSNPVITVRTNTTGFFVMYNNKFSSTDQDIRGMFVRTDATVQSDFSIDFSSASDWAGDATPTFPASHQIYVVYTRQSPNELRGAYIQTDGTVTNKSAPVPADDPGASFNNFPKVVLGTNNNMAIAWHKASVGEVQMAYVPVGSTAISAPTNTVGLASGAPTISLDFNAGLGRFVLAYAQASPDSIVARTFASGCPSSGCMSSARSVISRIDSRGADWTFQARAVGSSFVVAGTLNGSDRLQTVQLGGTGAAGTVKVETLASSPNTFVLGGTTIGTLNSVVFGVLRSTGPTVIAKRYGENASLAATFTVAD